MLFLSTNTIKKKAELSTHHRPKVIVGANSMFKRNRSNHVELLARCFDVLSENAILQRVSHAYSRVVGREHLSSGS
jgi:hypothetical protein